MAERAVLASSKEFRQFWKEKGPFQYALTSREFPPILLEPEEWIFSNDAVLLLKDLMGFDGKKMKIIPAPFNLKKKAVLRPEKLSPWKINHFPEAWNGFECRLFVPEGHLTRDVTDSLEAQEDQADAGAVEAAFFSALVLEIDRLGYLLLKPEKGSAHASVTAYLDEWEEDEADAGLL